MGQQSSNTCWSGFDNYHFNTGHKANCLTQTNLFPALWEEKYKTFVFCTLKKDNTEMKS